MGGMSKMSIASLLPGLTLAKSPLSVTTFNVG